jgi:mono/diheme cytochrome c family protein
MVPSKENIEKLLARRRRRVVQNSVSGMSAALGALLLLVVAIILLGSSAGGDGPAGGGSRPELSEGQRLYIQNCAPCHAQDGSGNASIEAPAINQDGEVWQWSQSELEEHVLEGGGNMPALSGQLDADQVEIILSFIQDWWTEDQLDSFRANP